jgi:hypothetical protein
LFVREGAVFQDACGGPEPGKSLRYADHGFLQIGMWG